MKKIVAGDLLPHLKSKMITLLTMESFLKWIFMVFKPVKYK